MVISRLLPLLIAASLAQQAEEVQVDASLNRQTAHVGETVLLTISLRAPGLQSPEIDGTATWRRKKRVVIT